MYVCLCHGFTEKQVRSAVSQGPCTVSEVYRRLGETPQCGQCVGSVVDIARSSHGADEHATLA
jgi:bacterioferritin-associated ferredoxin